MSHKSLYSIFLVFFLGAALVISLGCDVSDVNKQNSISSGTTTGSGSSGGAPATVTVTATNNTISAGATTNIIVILTDSSGKRTDASIVLTSSGTGTFNGTNTTLNGSTLGGYFSATYTAPTVSAQTDVEIAATVSWTTLKGSTIITITP